MNRSKLEQQLEQWFRHPAGCVEAFDRYLAPFEQLDIVELRSKVRRINGRFCFAELSADQLEQLIELMRIIQKKQDNEK